MKLLTSLLLAATTIAYSSSANAFTVTLEEPEVQNEQFSEDVFVVDFNNITPGLTSSFSSEDNSTSSNYLYSGNFQVQATDYYGGADNSNYITSTDIITNYSISIDKSQKYFGLWWSAGDVSNTLVFKKEGSIVATFNTADVINLLGTLPNGNQYYCNPTNNFYGQICSEPYAYLHFFFEGSEEYDEIVFETSDSSTRGSKFESDNHTFSVNELPVTGTIITSVNPPIIFPD